MASTYTTSLGLEIQATGENRASWGSKTNTNLSLIEEAISTLKVITVPDADITLSKVNAGTDQSRPAMLRFGGALTANRTVTIPTVSKFYFMQNNTDGSKNVIVSTGSATFVLAPGQWKLIFTDGSNLWSSDSLFSASSATRRWDVVGNVDATGNMEIGKAIDFHNANADATDFAVRLETGGTTTDLYVTPAGLTGKKIWNSGNDGAGSGMDADLLDGLHANQIYTDAPSDGKQYLRKNGAWVAVETPWGVDANGDAIFRNSGGTICVRIRLTDGFIRTASDVQIYSTTVVAGG